MEKLPGDDFDPYLVPDCDLPALQDFARAVMKFEGLLFRLYEKWNPTMPRVPTESERLGMLIIDQDDQR